MTKKEGDDSARNFAAMYLYEVSSEGSTSCAPSPTEEVCPHASLETFKTGYMKLKVPSIFFTGNGTKIDDFASFTASPPTEQVE